VSPTRRPEWSESSGAELTCSLDSHCQGFFWTSLCCWMQGGGTQGQAQERNARLVGHDDAHHHEVRSFSTLSLSLRLTNS
jgi:hypothetical protein